jgi:hypothetical protein
MCRCALWPKPSPAIRSFPSCPPPAQADRPRCVPYGLTALILAGPSAETPVYYVSDGISRDSVIAGRLQDGLHVNYPISSPLPFPPVKVEISGVIGCRFDDQRNLHFHGSGDRHLGFVGDQQRWAAAHTLEEIDRRFSGMVEALWGRHPRVFGRADEFGPLLVVCEPGRRTLFAPEGNERELSRILGGASLSSEQACSRLSALNVELDPRQNWRGWVLEESAREAPAEPVPLTEKELQREIFEALQRPPKIKSFQWISDLLEPFGVEHDGKSHKGSHGRFWRHIDGVGRVYQGTWYAMRRGKCMPDIDYLWECLRNLEIPLDEFLATVRRTPGSK